MSSLRFPKPWTAEVTGGGYLVRDAKGVPLAYVYGKPPDRISVSQQTLTTDEACRIAKLIARLPELVELEQDRNKPRHRRKPQSLLRPVTLGDLARNGTLLEVGCDACHRHLFTPPLSLGLPRRMPVPDVADHLVCSKCGARNDKIRFPIWARPDARVPGEGRYPDFIGKRK